MSQRHLVECHCILPLYKNRKPTVYHKFAVYSKIDKKTGNVIPKYVNCNNCGITHFVFEICKSEIKIGKEDITSVRSIKDIAISFPSNLKSILEEYQSSIDIYEEVEEILENNSFPKNIILKREIIDENYNFKILTIKSENVFKLETEIINTVLIK